MENESSFDIFDKAIRHALKNYWNHSHYDDMYQECYMKILDVLKNNTYEPIYNLYGYAYTISRNTISTYMYHHKKDPTPMSDDYFPEIPENLDFTANAVLDEVLEEIITKYKRSLPEDFTKDDLMNLLYTDDISDLTLTVVKGDLIWTLVSYLS